MSVPIVIDSSVAIKWVIPEIGFEQAVLLRSRFIFFAPQLMIAEIANILWKKCQRGEISNTEAGIAANLLANAGVEYLSMVGMLAKATELAIALAHPAYDCIYLVAAADLGCPFVTADSRLLNKLRQQGFASIKCVDLAEAAAL